MERTVPSTASEEIELYLRTIYSLLRSTTEVQIRTLEEVHAGMNSSLHPDARATRPDTSAFIYSLLRLPPEMPRVERIAIGQSYAVFCQHGYGDLTTWMPTAARARRRRCFFNGRDSLAVFIASRSDIDDLIPTLVAYQIEWNKLHVLLNRCPQEFLHPGVEDDAAGFPALARALEMGEEDLARLWAIWEDNFLDNLLAVRGRALSLRVQLLSGSYSDYQRATRSWWDGIEQACRDIQDRPVYFVSSNPHSLPNILSGFALRQQETLVEFVRREENPRLLEEWQAIERGAPGASRENFLYYVLKKYQQSASGGQMSAAQRAEENRLGFQRITNPEIFEIEAQILPLSGLQPEWFDPRLLGGEQPLSEAELQALRRSDAVILNVDYPLGLAAYNILSKTAEHVGSLQGVYIMGKAATLNGVRGDVMIPAVVHDEHTQNTYLFQNSIRAVDVAPFLNNGTVLDNQKAVTVLGTFLQNSRVMDVIYREGYTDIEMEAGPYLSAVYEMYRPRRHPVNEIVNLYGAPFDLGIVHYASDTPMSKGKNLGAGTLSYFGMDATYATMVAIARRILRQELARLKG